MSESQSEPAFADVDPNERFETGWNRLQIAIEVTVGLIVLAGLAGLLGTGPLSSAQVTVPGDPLAVSYQRIMRRTEQAEVTVAIRKPMAGSQVSVTLPNSFLQMMDIVSTSPRSIAMRAERNGVTYVFELGADGVGDLVFSTKARTAGRMSAAFAVQDVPIPISLLVLP